MRDTFLPFALPDTDEQEIREISDVIRSGWLTTGPKTKQFEALFAAAVGAKYAVAVNSCTAALHLALEAIGLRAGDEVITTPYTFAATSEVIRYFDAKPVFVDVRADDLNIDPRLIERAITPLTRAILPVHIAGQPAEMDAIGDIARRRGLKIIDDAAHAFPCSYRGRSVGTLGDMTCYSFYATKTITTGEGGMLTTDSPDWAERCRVMSLHGISGNAWKRYAAEGSWFYEIIAPGYKYNMTDVTAAMGVAQLHKAERMWARRAEIARLYSEEMSRLPELQLPFCRSGDRHSWHLYMVRLVTEALTIDRSGFVAELKKRRIGVSVHFIPLHIHPYYREKYGYPSEAFPVAYREYQREISLPIYSRMSDRDVRDVIEAMVDVVSRHRR